MRKKIKHLMVDKGWTLKDLAEKTGYTPQHISNVIRGEVGGSQKFWNRFKEACKIPDSEMESYRRNE